MSKKVHKVDFDLTEAGGAIYMKGSLPGWKRGTLLTDGKVTKIIYYTEKLGTWGKSYSWTPRPPEQEKEQA